MAPSRASTEPTTDAKPRREGPAVPRLARSVSEACEALGVSWDTWRQQIEPDVKLVRLGRRKLIPTTELQAWLDRHAERGPAVTYAFIRLDDDQLERLADLVAQRLGRTTSARGPLVDARELARLLGVSRSVVYDHARDLGAIRIGAGERGRLRFDPEVATRAAHTTFSPEPAAAVQTRPGGPRAPKRETARARHPFLEPTAMWDSEAGLWRDAKGYPTHDQCWRSNDLGTQGLVAEGPNHEPGATHHAWEAARREWRKEHRQHVEPNVRAKPSLRG